VLAIPVVDTRGVLFFYPAGVYYQYPHHVWFVLAIGIVVDDAIIVVEAVQHFIDEQHYDAKGSHLPGHERNIGPR